MVDTSKIKPHFDYGDILPEHVDAANEIASLAEKQGLTEFAKEIKQQFKIVEPKKYDMSQSRFAKYCEMANIFLAGQGTIIEGKGTDAMHYPLCCVNEDIRKLEVLVDIIKTRDIDNENT